MTNQEDIKQEDSAQGPAVRRFLRTPGHWVGIAGIVIGIAVAMIGHWASQKTPELTAYVHPVRAATVRADETPSNFTVQYKGESVEGDLTTAHVTFWNAGRKPLRPDDVLSPMVVRTANGERILEVSLRRSSREIVGLALDQSRLESGEVEIGWDILEKGDGGILQIIYVGDEDVSIQTEAVFVGQPEILQSEEPQAGRTLGDYLMWQWNRQTRITVPVVMIVLVFLELGREVIRSRRRQVPFWEFRLYRALFLGSLWGILIVMAIFVTSALCISSSVPTFGP